MGLLDGGFLDWSLNTADGIAATDATSVIPNGGAFPTSRPTTTTGGEPWGQWFDRIVNSAVTLRAAYAGDARITSYPGFQSVMAGDPTQPNQGGAGGNLMPLMLLAGIGLAAYFILKK